MARRHVLTAAIFQILRQQGVENKAPRCLSEYSIDFPSNLVGRGASVTPPYIKTSSRSRGCSNWGSRTHARPRTHAHARTRMHTRTRARVRRHPVLLLRQTLKSSTKLLSFGLETFSKRIPSCTWRSSVFPNERGHMKSCL